MEEILGEHWRRVQTEALGLIANGWDVQLCKTPEFFDSLQLAVMPVHCSEHRLEFDGGGKNHWADTNPLNER